MKKSLRLPVFIAALTSLAGFAGCEQKSAAPPAPPVADRAEIERQVQQRLAEEHAAEDARKLKEKEQTLTQREQDIATREQQLQAQRDQDAQARKAAQDAAAQAAQANNPPPVEDQSTNDLPPAYGGPVAVEPQEQGNYTVFYNDLEPDGDWIDTDNYGYVWHPYVANNDRGWRPYCNGHWVYADCGWTWVSDERFGWATYHYGRWAQIPRVGWIWVPGKQWAPAWVSWRNGNDYVGWAPLPPEARMGRNRNGFGRNVDADYRIGAGNYLFVQVGQFRAARMRDVVLDQGRNGAIINQTTNITNITNTSKIVINKGNNQQAVVNQGPPAAFIEARTKIPVKKLTLTDVQGNKPTAVNGDQLEIAAPKLDVTAGATPAKPNKVKERLTGVRGMNVGPVAGGGQPSATPAPGASPVAGTSPTPPTRPQRPPFPGGKPTATPPAATPPVTATPTPAAGAPTPAASPTPAGGSAGTGRPAKPPIKVKPGVIPVTQVTPPPATPPLATPPPATAPPATVTPRHEAIIATPTPAPVAATPDAAAAAALKAEQERKAAELEAAKAKMQESVKLKAEQDRLATQQEAQRKAADEAAKQKQIEALQQQKAAQDAAQQQAEKQRQLLIQEQQKAQAEAARQADAAREAAREAAQKAQQDQLQKQQQLQMQLQQQHERVVPPPVPPAPAKTGPDTSGTSGTGK